MKTFVLSLLLAIMSGFGAWAQDSLALISRDGKSLAFFEPLQAKVSAGPFRVDSRINSAAMASNRGWIACALSDGSLIFIDSVTGENFRELRDPRLSRISSLAVDDVHQKIYAVSQDLSAVIELDIALGKVTRVLPVVGPEMYRATYDFPSRRISLLHFGGRITQVDLDSWSISREDTKLRNFSDLSRVQDGLYLAAIEDTGQLQLIEYETQDVIVDASIGDRPSLLLWPDSSIHCFLLLAKQNAVASYVVDYAGQAWKTTYPEALLDIGYMDEFGLIVACSEKYFYTLQAESGQPIHKVSAPFIVGKMIVPGSRR